MQEPSGLPDNLLSFRSLLLLLVVCGALLLLSWFCLVYLGSLSAASQGTALIGIRIVSVTVTTVTALLLSRSAAARSSPKPWRLTLGALLQVLLAFVGLTILPVAALILWNGEIDFEQYSQKSNLLLLLVPAAAVSYCLTRDVGSKK